MPTVTFQGNPVTVSGTLPTAGDQAPSFTLCATDLADLSLAQLQGKTVVLNIFPSIDTPVCALSVRKFNETLAKTANTIVLCVSADLPFAFSRFCAAENIEGVQGASFFRADTFAEDYGVKIAEGPLKGLATRAVVVISKDGKIAYSELVGEITDEPNYEQAIAAVNALA